MNDPLTLTPFKHILVIHKTKHTDMQGKREYIGRPSIWGNPFASKPSKVGLQIAYSEWQSMPQPWAWLVKNHLKFTIRVESDAIAVELFRQLLREYWVRDITMRDMLMSLARGYLQGDTSLLLVCWCKPTVYDTITPCHGDPLKDALLGIIAKGLVE